MASAITTEQKAQFVRDGFIVLRDVVPRELASRAQRGIHMHTVSTEITRPYHALVDDSVKVNAVSPGWVKTDMGGEYAHRSLEDGADTIVWLACEESGELNSQFVEDRAPVAW